MRAYQTTYALTNITTIMNVYTLQHKETRLHHIWINVISAAVREGDIFVDRGENQIFITKDTHIVIRSLKIKEHKYIQEIYKDILFELQERIAQTEGQAFMLDTADKILIEGFNCTLEIILHNATLNIIYCSTGYQDEY